MLVKKSFFDLMIILGVILICLIIVNKSDNQNKHVLLTENKSVKLKNTKCQLKFILILSSFSVSKISGLPDYLLYVRVFDSWFKVNFQNEKMFMNIGLQFQL